MIFGMPELVDQKNYRRVLTFYAYIVSISSANTVRKKMIQSNLAVDEVEDAGVLFAPALCREFYDKQVIVKIDCAILARRMKHGVVGRSRMQFLIQDIQVAAAGLLMYVVGTGLSFGQWCGSCFSKVEY